MNGVLRYYETSKGLDSLYLIHFLLSTLHSQQRTKDNQSEFAKNVTEDIWQSVTSDFYETSSSEIILKIDWRGIFSIISLVSNLLSSNPYRYLNHTGVLRMNRPSPDSERHGKIGNSPVAIGRYTYGEENLKVKEWGEGATLRIGSFCSIAANVTCFLGGNHRTDWITTYPFGHIFGEQMGIDPVKGHPKTNGDIIIGNDVWIGSNVTIMSGITIGDGAVISANSHVIKDIGRYTIAGGNPAQEIKRRFSNEVVDLLLKLSWWELPLTQIKTIHHDLTKEPSLETLKLLIKDLGL